MSFDYFVRSGQSNLRCGFTTGTCASLAAKLACQALLSGSFSDEASVITSKGIIVTVPLFHSGFGTYYGTEDDLSAWASVEKDAGDDSDVTHGAEIVAQVSLEDADSLQIIIDGGEGVGRVTKPGLDQPVGNAAINSGPRASIEKSIREVCEAYEYNGKVKVIVLVPAGRELATKTFNPSLGIEGGISILGTSGIVEPMSEKALVETIAVTLRQARLKGTRVILTPGSIGESFIEKSEFSEYGIPVVKVSNFIGDALDIAKLEGFEEILLVGNIGKLCKLAAGIMNTHSKYADGRNEVFVSMAAVNGASRETCEKLMDAVSTDAFIEILDQEGIREQVMCDIFARIQMHLDKRLKDACRIGAASFSSAYGYLGETYVARILLDEWKEV